MSDYEQRLTELEVKLAFIDDAVQALVTADADQSVRIATLERMIRDLRSELATVRTGQGHDPHSEPPPPHY
ncbi:SlyX family protein [Dyella dinghuensis]|uniref:SlyX family protein n=1 Tax=Dyella dinghuensis TaxID=1920169 RepID=A0A3S0QYN8_9GAMM|nr:SlyX family protein [Dyella dinghuensis]RUL66113.1 SlyX family protein [Dyella dinghuensis]